LERVKVFQPLLTRVVRFLTTRTRCYPSYRFILHLKRIQP
jgi:hypothetical protein